MITFRRSVRNFTLDDNTFGGDVEGTLESGEECGARVIEERNEGLEEDGGELSVGVVAIDDNIVFVCAVVSVCFPESDAASVDGVFVGDGWAEGVSDVDGLTLNINGNRASVQFGEGAEGGIGAWISESDAHGEGLDEGEVVVADSTPSCGAGTANFDQTDFVVTDFFFELADAELETFERITSLRSQSGGGSDGFHGPGE